MENTGHKPVLAISGFKNSGKTTLIEKILPLLTSRGLEVGVIKHDGHSFTPDTPGTDSFRFFEAGAAVTAVFDDEKFSVSVRKQLDVKRLIALMDDVDLVLMEGFKNSDYPKIVLLTEAYLNEPPLISKDCIAIVCNHPVKADVPVLGFDDIDGIADIITHFARKKR